MEGWTFSDGDIQDVIREWSSIPPNAFHTNAETERDSRGVDHLNMLIQILQLRAKTLPDGAASRCLLARNNEPVCFSHDSQEILADGLDEKDFRLDAIVVRKGVTAKDVSSSRGFDLVHVPMEFKTATGSSPQGQVGSYSSAFRPLGSRYQVAASVRETIISVFVFSPTHWCLWQRCRQLLPFRRGESA